MSRASEFGGAYLILELSSQGWHEGKHDPWHYVNYLLFILKTAYREFESRVGEVKRPRGAKTEMIESAVTSFVGEFTLADLEQKCAHASIDMVRTVLRNQQKAGKVECLGYGPGASWRIKRG
jgi:hypothetical protein